MWGAAAGTRGWWGLRVEASVFFAGGVLRDAGHSAPITGLNLRSFSVPAAPARERHRGSFIGWSNKHFNDLHFMSSLETKHITTCAAEQSLMLCLFEM